MAEINSEIHQVRNTNKSFEFTVFSYSNTHPQLSGVSANPATMRYDNHAATLHISTNHTAFLNMPSQLAQTDVIPCTANQTHLAIKQAISLNAARTLYPSLFNLSSYILTAHTAASVLSNPIYATFASTPAYFALHYHKPDPKTQITASHLFPNVLLNLNSFSASTYAS